LIAETNFLSGPQAVSATVRRANSRWIAKSPVPDPVRQSTRRCQVCLVIRVDKGSGCPAHPVASTIFTQ
jgi:hypothetical protein